MKLFVENSEGCGFLSQIETLEVRPNRIYCAVLGVDICGTQH